MLSFVGKPNGGIVPPTCGNVRNLAPTIRFASRRLKIDDVLRSSTSKLPLHVTIKIYNNTHI